MKLFNYANSSAIFLISLKDCPGNLAGDELQVSGVRLFSLAGNGCRLTLAGIRSRSPAAPLIKLINCSELSLHFKPRLAAACCYKPGVSFSFNFFNFQAALEQIPELLFLLCP